MKKKEFLPYMITAAVGVLFSAFVAVITILADTGASDSGTGLLAAMADATFVTGVLLFGVGGISFANRQGIFDAIGFSFESIFVVRNLSPKRRFKERENFAEYKERKEKARKQKIGVTHFFATGGAFLLLSVIMIALYYAVSQSY